MLPIIEDWPKKAALEVQEYVYLVAAAFRAIVTPPLYRHDIICYQSELYILVEPVHVGIKCEITFSLL